MGRNFLRPIVPHPIDPGLALVPLTRGYFAVIDVIDAADVGQFNWSAFPHRGTVYGRRNVRLLDGKYGCEYLHRFVAGIAGLDVCEQIDHRNRNGLDCRRQNLRSATHGQNQSNSKIRSDNKTGIKGVCWDKRERKWKAYIKVDGRMKNLGTFSRQADAAMVVSTARTRLHGEFSRSN